MRTRTQTIQSLIDDLGYKSYLEIGLGDGNNFRAIKCEEKIGVDPEICESDETYCYDSDTFFNRKEIHGYSSFDLIFIDGLHHSDQVERDIQNAWECLNKGGMILIHDIKPPSYEAQIVPRQQRIWTGDVWRVWSGLKKTNLNLDYIEETYGLGVIYKSRHKMPEKLIDNETNFEEYFNSQGWML